MNRTVTLERAGKMVVIVLRQLPHDPPAIIDRKFKYGSGRCWTVKEIK